MSEAREQARQADAARREGEAAASLALYRQAMDAFGDDAAGRAHCLRHIADLEREAGRMDIARAALAEAEALYRGPVRDPLSLANTLRLRALVDGDKRLWAEARRHYETAAQVTGLDLEAAFRECDLHLAAG